MSKHTDIDQLETKIRELKAIIRSLQKKLKKASKGYRKHLIEELDQDDREMCPSCTKGHIKHTIILNRVFSSCSVCDWKQIDTSGKL